MRTPPFPLKSTWAAGFLLAFFLVSLVTGGRVSEAPLSPPPSVKTLFPQDEIFEPLLADPKEARFSMGLGQYDSTIGRFTVVRIGLGEQFGIVRAANPKELNLFSVMCEKTERKTLFH